MSPQLQARGAARGRKYERRQQQRLRHELRERQRDIESRASRHVMPLGEVAPPLRIY
ncbi:hypothetical protein [Acidovorax sp. 56]|uniref:hypothetical protein n=1 Tax=Acidovorax sp. 56 TaxID=2035205 RepID=UPI001304202B|nr:hypothetical protein [Acidovorax sp. 56]